MVSWITTDGLDFSLGKATLEPPQSVELENDEAEMYSLIFQNETGAPVEVGKPLQECLRKFVDNGLMEKNYYKFIKLCHQAIKNSFDSVEKDGLQVINNQNDVSLICADKKGDWEVICTLERRLITKFHQNRNLGDVVWNNSTTSVPSMSSAGSAGTVTVKNEGHSLIPYRKDSDS